MENQETQPQEQTSKFDGIEEALDVKTEIMQADTSIPDWIKNNAGWWSSGLIDLSLIHI